MMKFWFYGLFIIFFQLMKASDEISSPIDSRQSGMIQNSLKCDLCGNAGAKDIFLGINVHERCCGLIIQAINPVVKILETHFIEEKKLRHWLKVLFQGIEVNAHAMYGDKISLIEFYRTTGKNFGFFSMSFGALYVSEHLSYKAGKIRGIIRTGKRNNMQLLNQEQLKNKQKLYGHVVTDLNNFYIQQISDKIRYNKQVRFNID